MHLDNIQHSTRSIKFIVLEKYNSWEYNEHNEQYINSLLKAIGEWTDKKNNIFEYLHNVYFTQCTVVYYITKRTFLILKLLP